MTDPDEGGKSGKALSSYMQALHKPDKAESEPGAPEAEGTAAPAQSGGSLPSFLDGLEEEFGLETAPAAGAAEPEATPRVAEPEAAPRVAEPEAAPRAAEPEAAPRAAEPEAAPRAAEPAPSAANPAGQGAEGPSGGDDSMSRYREALKQTRDRASPAAREVAGEPAPGAGATAGPSGGGDDSMSRYQEALEKKRNPTRPAAEEAAPEPTVVAPAMEPEPVGGVAAGPAGGGDDSMDRYLSALNKSKDAKPAPAPAAEAAPLQAAPQATLRGTGPREVGPKNKTGIFQRGLDRLQQRGVKPLGERKKKPERKRASPQPAPRRKQKAAARGAGTAIAARLFGAPAWAIKGVTLVALLGVALSLQVMVYTFGGVAYAPQDLGAGATVLFPVVLLLVLVEPETPNDWLALLASAAAIAVTGSLGIALGLSLLQIEAMRQAAYLIQLFAHLTILTVLWGPVFLMIAALLERRDLLELTDPLKP